MSDTPDTPAVEPEPPAPFWLVFADEGGRYLSYDSAEEFARQRAALNPLTEFFVLRAVARVAAEDPLNIVVEEIPEEEPDEEIPEETPP